MKKEINLNNSCRDKFCTYMRIRFISFFKSNAVTFDCGGREVFIESGKSTVFGAFQKVKIALTRTGEPLQLYFTDFKLLLNRAIIVDIL